MIRFGLLNTNPIVSDLTNFKTFHNLLFGNTNITMEWLEWYLNIDHCMAEIGVQKPRIYCAFNDDTIIGSWCVEPKRFSIQGRPTLVGRCFAVGMHPERRRLGLFKDLSEFAIEQERVLGVYEYIVGFPQVGKPVVEAHLKSGWQHVQQIGAYSLKPSRPKSLVSMHNFDTRFSDGFRNLTHTDYVSNGTPDKTVSGFLNAPAYKTSRWIYHPDHSYVCIRTNAGRNDIVIKPYSNVAHILELEGSIEEAKTLLECAKTLAYRHRWDELTIWCADNEYLHEAIETSGFVPGAEHILPVYLLALQINATTSLDLRQSHFSMGCEEVY